MKNALRLTIASFAVAAVALPVSAVVRRVDHTSPGNGPGDALNWSNAYNNLTAALAAASSGDVLWVADGVYKPVSQSSSFVLKPGVRVLGGFTGYGPGHETLEAQRNLNPATNGCILSGDLNDNDVPATWSNYGENCYTVVRGANLNDPLFDTELDAFTVKGGNSQGIPGGGGILVLASTGKVRILRCRIIDNLAAEEGGGVKLAGVNAGEIRWCDITHNACGGQGGAGIDLKGSNTDVVFTRVTNNAATGSGGGIFTADNTTNIFNCVITGNSSGSWGGGIFSFGTTSTLVRIVNTLVADNDSPSAAGGGMYSNAEQVEIIDSTFAANTTGTYGGGIYFLSTSGAVIANSIFWGNTANSGDPQIAVNANPVTVTESDVQQPSGTWPGTGNINSDPIFVAPSQDNYRLGCASPCIDVADNNLIPADAADVDVDGNFTEDVPWDLDTRARVVNVTVDMGAYENTINTDCPANINTSGTSVTVVDINDLLALIGVWGQCPAGPASCPGDIASTSGCGGDGVVDINDLLAVLGAWGVCGGEPETFPGGLNDCFNVYCAGLSGAAWQECLTKCFDAFCEARPTECD